MKLVRSPSAAAAFCRRAPSPIVLVPTMGALHRGHEKLIRKGRQLAGKDGTLVVSIYVNPTQFGPREDFKRYPRTLAADKMLCESEGANLVFAPSSLYAENASVFVDEYNLSTGLCGSSRPGHFRGVCTVVAILFLITSPDIAVFGCKDYQQLAVIRRMVRDLHFPIRIVGAETVRERDGLAISSRNRYLNESERAQAVAIIKALKAAKKAAASGTDSAARLQALIAKEINRAPKARIDYVEIVHPETLEPIRTIRSNAVAAVAVFFGKTRLIDNITLSCPSGRSDEQS